MHTRTPRRNAIPSASPKAVPSAARRRPTSLVGVVLLGLLAAGPAAAQSPNGQGPEAEARAAVDETVGAVLAVLRDDALSTAEKRDQLETLAYDRFDFATISKLVLARNWRKFTPEQREQFQEEFKRHLSLTYGKSLDGYQDQQVEISGTRTERNGDVTVRSRLITQDSEPVLINYRLRKQGDRWFVIDVIIEGVSLLSNFRSQTQEMFTKHGADGLIQELRAKNDSRATES